VTTAADPPPLVVLPGGLGVADGGGEALATLAQGRRLERVDYAGLRDFDSLLDRVLRAAGNAARFDLIGFSIGGWFAQCVAAQAPDAVRKVVLAHSFLLEPKLRWRFAAALKIWPLLPRSVVRAGVMRRLRVALEPLETTKPETHEETVRAVAETLSRSDTIDLLIAQQHLIHDSLAHPLGPVTAPMLIVDSSTDPLVGAKARARLRSEYPKAEHVGFRGAGHISALVEPERFATAVDTFLRA
jgi:3-oxoadipate enol-lactonase